MASSVLTNCGGNRNNSSIVPSSLSSQRVRLKRDSHSEVKEKTAASGAVSALRESMVSVLPGFNRLKHCSFYWGPLTAEQSERVLANESIGSFLLRDSTSDRYIFSLAIKIPTKVTHARIDYRFVQPGCSHEETSQSAESRTPMPFRSLPNAHMLITPIPVHGVYRFGSSELLEDPDVVSLVEKSVQRSKLGTLNFFIHRSNRRHRTSQDPFNAIFNPFVDPIVNGDENVNVVQDLVLEKPVLRDGNSPQSLQHLSRFVVRCIVPRKDQIKQLPLPHRVIAYLKDPQYFVERSRIPPISAPSSPSEEVL